MNDEVKELQQELSSLRQLTMSTMKVSSDLGLAVQFLKDSFSIPDYTALATALITTLDTQNLSASVSMETYTGRVFVCHEGESDHSTEGEMQSKLLLGRLIEEGESLQINYPNTSLLVHNMPEDEERRGQLRDALALLLDGVEARVKSLVLEEKTEEARQSKEEFFALMSHELRTPLNPIIGYASRLEKKLSGKIDQSHARAISSIKNNAEGLLRLINHIIDIGKLEAGEIKINCQLVNLAEAFERALIISEPILEDFEVKIQKNIPKTLSLLADPSRLIDIAVSLICYAAQASRQHTIKIETHQTADSVEFTITDYSAPLTAAYQTKIFENFSERKLDSVYESNDLGIGLYLTKKLVELHRGTIELIPSAKGNKFSVAFPRIEPNAKD